MKRFGLLVFCLAFGARQMSAMTDPEVRFVDNRVSIQADAVPLSQLLYLLAEATGMTSKVPSELANLPVSVRFSNLDLNDAIPKIFEGQALNYVFVEGQSIIVTGAAQAINYKNLPAAAPSPAAPGQPEPQPPAAANAIQNPPGPNQPPVGTVANPQAGPTAPPQPPNAAPTTPGQGGAQNQNPFTSTLPGFMGPNPVVEGTSGANTVNSTQPPSSYPNTVPNNGGFPPPPNIMPNRINP